MDRVQTQRVAPSVGVPRASRAKTARLLVRNLSSPVPTNKDLYPQSYLMKMLFLVIILLLIPRSRPG